MGNGYLMWIQHTLRSLYASPDGIVHGRGRIEHTTKSGPGRRRPHQEQNPAGSKLGRKAFHGEL